MNEGPHIYLWKTKIGWRFRVLFDRSGTTALWRPTRSMALRVAQQIVKDKA